MADRFWVGGTGNINDTARWAATSGGAGGQSVPTAADNAFFDGLSDRLTTQSVTSITRVSTTATVTCNNHGYSAGNTVTISGANETEYNGTFTISNVATNTFDYTVTGTPATPATGTITVARRAAFTVTINATFNCLSFIVGDGVAATALTQAMTFAGSSSWNIYGSLFFPATSFTCNFIGEVLFGATTSGNIITLNGATLASTSGQACRFAGIGGVWTLASSGTFTGSNGGLLFQNGTLNTAGYTVAAFNFVRVNGDVFVLNLGSSTINVLRVMQFTYVTGFTFNAGTSTINAANSLQSSLGTGLTYYNVNFTTPATAGCAIGSNTTFNNLSITVRNSTGITNYFFGDITVNGTLAFQTANTSHTQRAQIMSDTIGVSRTITAAAVTIGDGVDFRNITIAGAAAPLNASTKSTGNLGGNSGITFPAAKTVYWNLAGTQNWSATGWATTSTGTPAAANFPLAQDTAVFTEAGAAGTVTIDSAYWAIGTLTFDDGVSPRASGVTISFSSNGLIFYGNLRLSSGVVLVGGTQTIYFSGQTSQTVTSAGKSFLNPIILDSPGGSLTLADNLTLDTSRSFTLTRGTLDLNNRTLTAWTFISDNSNTRAIAFGTTGVIRVFGGSDVDVVSMGTVTNFSFSGTSDIELTYTGSTGKRNIVFGVATFPNSATETNVLNYRVTAGLDRVVMLVTSGSPSFYRNLVFSDAFSGVWGWSIGPSGNGNPGTCFGNIRFSPNMTFELAADLTIAATSSTQQFTSSGLTFPRSITKSGAGSLQLVDNLTLASTRTFTHTAGSVLLNGKILTTPVYSTSNTNARTLAFGTGELVLNGTGTVWNAATSNGLSISAGTGVIRITDTSATGKTFAGGGVQTYPDLRIEGGTSTSTITLTGANRFSKMTNARTVGYTIVFPNETTTFNAWGLSGTDGNLVTLSRTGGSGQFTIQSGSSGLLIAQFVSISNSIFLPSGNGYAVKSTNGGGNNGWVFGAPTFGKFLVFFNP